MTDATHFSSFPRTSQSALICVFMAGVLWSTIGLGIRLIEDAQVWQILLYRSASLSVFLFFVIWLRTGSNPIRQAIQTGGPGIIGALALVAAYTGGIYAIQVTSVANALLLFASAPFIAAVLGWLILRERVRPATWIAIIVAIVGIGIMVADGASGGAFWGNMAGLGAALGFAAFTVALRWGRSGEMMPAILLSGIFALVIMLTICLAAGLPLVLSSRDGGVALGMGVFQVGLGLVLYTLGSRAVPAAELTLLSLAEVVLAPVWVWLVLGETAATNTLIGGALLLAAIAGNALSGARRKPPPLTTP